MSPSDQIPAKEISSQETNSDSADLNNLSSSLYSESIPKKRGAKRGSKHALGHGAPKGNKNAVGNKGQLKYKPEFDEIAKRFCLLNQEATDEDLAILFQVSTRTIVNWKNKYESFKDAVNEGKVHADSNVANALYQRAIGYSHPAVKIFADPKTGDEMVVPYTEHYPPDTNAARIWLTNRSKRWKDKQTIEIEDPDEILSLVLGVPKESLPE